jgi:hypothetical protein
MRKLKVLGAEWGLIILILARRAVALWRRRVVILILQCLFYLHASATQGPIIPKFALNFAP